jgi:hypothetical protein
VDFLAVPNFFFNNAAKILFERNPKKSSSFRSCKKTIIVNTDLLLFKEKEERTKNQKERKTGNKKKRTKNTFEART